MTNPLNETTINFLEKVFFSTYDTIAITEESEKIARELQKNYDCIYYDAENFSEEGDLLKPNLSCSLINSLLKESMYLYGHHNDVESFEKFKEKVAKNMDIMEELQLFYNEYNNFIELFTKKC